MAIKFDLPKDQLSIIKVIGVGGGGSNAVNHMYEQGIKDVDFMVCNTDQQALDQSPVPTKIQLGASLTSGLGAGAVAEVGENAAIESIEDIKSLLGENTKMVFITAGMGGGTGTGAAPIIAKTAKELGILTVGIVTMPFSFEGRKRKRRAEAGMTNLRENVDTLLVINNDKLRELYGNLTLDNAFEQADNILTTAARGIAEAITYKGKINVDFNDVKTVMSDSGVAILGSANARGEGRALIAIEEAVNSPLLNDNDIRGAAHILLNITYGTNNILMDEITEITDFIEEKADEDAEVIWGHGVDDRLQDDEICITIVATGFQSSPDTGVEEMKPQPQRIVKTLDTEVKTELTKPIAEKPQPMQANIFEPPKPVENQPKEEEENPSPAISKTVLYSEPEKEESPDSEATSQVEESQPSPSEDKPIIRHTLEDDTFGSLEESKNLVEDNSKEEESNEETFNLEPTLKNEVEEETKEEVAATEEPHFNDPLETEDQEEEIMFEVKKVEESELKESKSPTDDLSPAERQASIKERMARLRNLSTMLKSPSGIENLESEPAFKRRSIELDDVQSSSESKVSRYTLSESEDQDGEKRTEIKPNNSFLHDNVD